GTYRIVRVAPQPSELSLSALLESGSHSFYGSFFFQPRRKIDQRHVRRGNADGNPGELPFQLRQYLPYGFSRAGGSRNHGQSTSPSAPQVLVWKVQNTLIVRVGVDGRHQAALHATVVEQYLR